MIKIGGQFSGVGAFDYALDRLGIDYLNIYQAEWDKYARQSYLANHKEPKYYIKDVHETPIQEITEKEGSLDLMMFSPPCQAFSLAGKRKGKADKRGILFFNSLEFIQVNKPRYFIFENVKGLLSDDNGNTFQEWINYLGGKSVNGAPVLFPSENSVPYHLYYKVLNSKKHGVPQNRERIFLVGIRDDVDNDFSFPKEEHLNLRLKDILEDQVDEKYFLSEKIQSQFVLYPKKGNIVGTTKPPCRTIGERDNVHYPDGYMSCLTATDYKQPKQILIKSNTIKGVPKTLDTQCNQGVMINKAEIQVMGNLKGKKGHNVQNYYSIEGISPTVMENHGNVTKVMMGGIIEQADIDNPLKGLTDYGWHFEQNVYSENSNITRTVTAGQGSGSRLKVIIDDTIKGYDIATVQKDNVVVYDVPQIVKIRKNDVDVKKLQELLKSHKTLSNKEMAKSLSLKKTTVDHWFRKDNSFSIPPANIWFELKTLLNIETNSFDKPITEFIERTGIFEKANRVYGTNGIAPTLDTQCNQGVIIDDTNLGFSKEHRFYERFSPTLRSERFGLKTFSKDFRIRKLTPLECFRLQDFPDSHVQKCVDAGLSHSQLYKQAGNSITVRVLELIIRKLKL